MQSVRSGRALSCCVLLARSPAAACAADSPYPGGRGAIFTSVAAVASRGNRTRGASMGFLLGSFFGYCKEYRLSSTRRSGGSKTRGRQPRPRDGQQRLCALAKAVSVRRLSSDVTPRCQTRDSDLPLPWPLLLSLLLLNPGQNRTPRTGQEPVAKILT